VLAVEPAALIEKYPVLFHMAEADSWASIVEHGLLSTLALLDLYSVDGPARQVIACERRAESVEIAHPTYGRAVIRDQKPLHQATLRRCLTDLSPGEWYWLLNSKVFFWPTEGRLRSLLGARSYRDRPHTVIRVDTRLLIERCEADITLSPINSGSTMRAAVARGSGTFQSIADYPLAVLKRRGVAEVAVNHGVRQIQSVALAAEVWVAGQPSHTVWLAQTGDAQPAPPSGAASG
jgi:hypothetical protein